LQVADLLAYPVKQEILIDNNIIDNTGDTFGRELCKVIAPKYNQEIYKGTVIGYGKVFLGGK